MKKYWKLIGGVLLLAVLIGGSTILYSRLSSEYKQDNLMEIGIDTRPSQDVPKGSADEGEKEQEAGQDAGTGQDAETGPDTENGQNAGTEQENNAQPAPDFTVVNGAGEEISLSDFLGKPVVLNFWASWCGPCKSEMPMFQEMYDTYGEDIGFLVVNMTDGSRETVETAQTYIEEQGYTFPVNFDTKLEAAYAYYVSSIPATYFIDAEGNLAAYGLGAMEEETFLTGLERLGIAQAQ